MNSGDVTAAGAAIDAVEAFVQTGDQLIQALTTAGWDVAGMADFRQQMDAFGRGFVADIKPMVDDADNASHSNSKIYARS